MTRLTITFDNGPDPECTPGVLDLLAERGIGSTFFVCGQGNQRHPAMQASAPQSRDILDRARDEGHWIGNHSLTHTVELGTTVDPQQIEQEIGGTDVLLDGYNYRRLFRPYMAGGRLGERTFSPPAVRYLLDHRYTVVLFNSCPRDWELPESWPEQALVDIDSREWTLLLVHDVARYGGMTALAGFFDEVERRGVEVVQDFPAECVPIAGGEIVDSLDGLVSDEVPFEPLQVSSFAIPMINPVDGYPRPATSDSAT